MIEGNNVVSKVRKPVRSTTGQKVKAIYEVAEQWAFDEGDTWLISFWELADNLNNSWYAPLFVDAKHKSGRYSETNIHWSVEHYKINEFRNMTLRTIRKMKGTKIIKQRGIEFFRIPKTTHSKEQSS